LALLLSVVVSVLELALADATYMADESAFAFFSFDRSNRYEGRASVEGSAGPSLFTFLSSWALMVFFNWIFSCKVDVRSQCMSHMQFVQLRLALRRFSA
jgi:hypothetical protein